MSESELEELNLLHYKYDDEKGAFLAEGADTVFVVKELVELLSVLEEKNIKYEVDEDSNIKVLAEP